MKDGKTKDGGRSAARKWVTIRVTEREKARLTEQAEIAGLSLSEYMRRRFFGGRLAAHLDLNAIAELRRIGGLLKHNFGTLRQARRRSYWNGRRTPCGNWSGPFKKSRCASMIVKKIKNKKAEKFRAWQIDDLTDCIMQSQ